MRICLLPIMLGLLVACEAAPVMPPPPDQSTSAQFTPARPTIVSLNPCADAILAEVAEPAQLLAISHYSHDPRATSMPLAQARRWPATGGTVEEVLALDPDVVVAGTFLPPATAAAFTRMGIRVELLGIASTVEASRAQVRQLASLAGHVDRGEAMVAQIDSAMARTRHDGGRAKVTALLWQQGGIVPGPDSLIVQLMGHTGLASHSAARGLGQGAYLPLERVLADPPALILVAGNERMLHHPALSHLQGVRHERLDPSLLYCGGPSIIRTLDRLARIRPLPLAGGVRDGPVSGIAVPSAGAQL